MNAYEADQFGVQALSSCVHVTGGPNEINVLDHEFVIVENSLGKTIVRLAPIHSDDGSATIKLPCGSFWKSCLKEVPPLDSRQLSQ